MAAVGKSAPALRKKSMEIAIYILYALIQGILVNRYYLKDTAAPVAAVVMMTIFAPVVSFLVVLGTFAEIIRRLATPKS